MINTQRYFIHIDNGSIVPWTSEIEENYKFKEISAKVAIAVARGKISTKDVIRQITRQIAPGTLEEMLSAKLKMNVREGKLNLESQIKEDNTQKDSGRAKPFSISGFHDDDWQSEKTSYAPSKPEKLRKSANKNDEKLADAPIDDAKRVASALGDGDVQSIGVNV
ncbi:MAG: hypothetical protein ACI4QT_10485 [Kiritimatiellia bacterium]